MQVKSQPESDLTVSGFVPSHATSMLYYKHLINSSNNTEIKALASAQRLSHVDIYNVNDGHNQYTPGGALLFSYRLVVAGFIQR